MSEEGFIKLHRSILNWDWADDSTVFYFFVRLIFAANYQKKRWHGIKVERGQLVTSIEKLCELTKFSKPTVRRCIDCLTQTGEIKESVADNRFRIITVVNYDKYQSVGKKTINTDFRVGKKSTNTGKKFTTPGKKSTDTGKNSTNSPTNSPTTTKELKKYLSPIRETDTAHAPIRLEGDGRSAKEQEKKPPLFVSWKEVREYSEFLKEAGTFKAEQFHDGFLRSKTAFPEDWKDVYKRYSQAAPELQEEFLTNLYHGIYRGKWGDAE